MAFTHGVVAIGRSAIVISGTEISHRPGSPRSAWWYGLYLADSSDIRLIGNSFWGAGDDHGPMGAGLSATNARQATLVGNLLGAGLYHGAVLMSGSTGWIGSANRFLSRVPVVDHAGGNKVR